jgi:DNA polymerase-3 subunit epsilon
LISKQLEVLSVALLCVIDTETTGLGKFDRSCPGHIDYPISIGAVIADVNTITKQVHIIDGMYSLIRIPNTSMAENTMLIHGILPEELDNAPQPTKVCIEFKSLLSKYDSTPIGAWNYQVDKYFVDILFHMAHMVSPNLVWKEMMPSPYASLDRHVKACVTHEGVLCLEAHNAYNDCIRALGVYTATKGYKLELPLSGDHNIPLTPVNA